MQYTQESILTALREGVPFRFDFESRSVRLGRKTLTAEMIDTRGFNPKDPIVTLEVLYALYRKSVPSRRNDAKKSRYFVALPEKELSDQDLMYGEDRDYAQGALELHLLICILTGAIDWNAREDFKGKWFWKSENHPDLILLRRWFTPKTENNNN